MSLNAPSLEVAASLAPLDVLLLVARRLRLCVWVPSLAGFERAKSAAFCAPFRA